MSSTRFFHKSLGSKRNTSIDFIHEPGKGPNPIPLIISHGWPWTFWHWSKVIGPLTDPAAYGGDPADAFDVYVPSLPGFGFSTPLDKPDLNFGKIADIFHKFMTQTLGHQKYAASGSDYGALITGQLGHKYANSLYGIHLGHAILLNIFQGERPWDLTNGFMVPEGTPDDIRDGILKFQRTYVSHVAVHMLDSAPLSYGLNDSPVGLLAWIMTRWLKWGDTNGDIESKYTKDEILTMASIYWFSNSIEMTIRMYTNANRYPCSLPMIGPRSSKHLPGLPSLRRRILQALLQRIVFKRSSVVLMQRGTTQPILKLMRQEDTSQDGRIRKPLSKIYEEPLRNLESPEFKGRHFLMLPFFCFLVGAS
ncbi:hypothetical protein AWM70_19310 [Paenibacillus yonginensis]|uniref:AB hydrolase-1 domain-containing protein n=1 Tax=Paenibacillus yonginensis TaxID=1462996 RepID=A0A1B1N4V9_9BACL|nr:alpha/beta fold hydrolase [Paenibacillus yonginensis]ANS76454.1 hypothetical protein AWM70_19310 [Paenibacillus yonginensis]